jgi:lipopolysaccharide transport system permease protein
MVYPVFVLAGLVPWLYFSGAVNSGGDSLTSQSYLLGKVYFPRFMLPLSVVLAGVPDLVIGSAVLSILLLATGMAIHPALLWVPFLFILLMWLALSIGTLFASLTIVYRDIRNIVPYFLQLLLFLTPIVYPPEAIPEKWSWLIRINPLTGLINSFRAVLLGESPIWPDVAVSIAITAVISLVSVTTFVKMERHVADYL